MFSRKWIFQPVMFVFGGVDHSINIGDHTVDGSEIRRGLVEVGSLSHYLLRVWDTSQVVTDIASARCS